MRRLRRPEPVDRHLCAADLRNWSRQDPARRRDHAREPQLRRVLRPVPGSGRPAAAEVHRGRVPGRGPARPEDRRATRLAARSARERAAPGRPDGGLQLRPGTPPAAHAQPEPEPGTGRASLAFFDNRAVVSALRSHPAARVAAIGAYVLAVEWAPALALRAPGGAGTAPVLGGAGVGGGALGWAARRPRLGPL